MHEALSFNLCTPTTQLSISWAFKLPYVSLDLSFLIHKMKIMFTTIFLDGCCYVKTVMEI